MKKLIFFLTVGLFYSASILAQSVDDEITLIQAEFGMGKRQLVDAVMDLPESVAPLFWTVYQEYEAERQLLSRERLLIINNYLENYDSITDELANTLANGILKNDAALAKLHARYFKRFKKATSARDAAKFLQLDDYIHNTIRNSIQQELPFIDEY
ncbi:MAG: hypothetical protein HLUCCX10_13940 [Algoriphagus marincola HL-49]|uniref:Uncharacterized protein n=1 Tax=Algoriphagus marincola HL-49 TaxID=1305737 RepID=A0A0P8BTJ8_9BACT|nr:MAG: hypothetical protein HLUCCX10_13940 [Algoriphagus marincola HL-49]